MPIFICPEPRGSTGTVEKRKKKRFKIGLIFPGKWYKYQKFGLHRENELYSFGKAL